MNRRDFLLKTFMLGGAVACASLGFSTKEIAWAGMVQKAKKKEVSGGCAGGTDGAIGSSDQSNGPSVAGNAPIAADTLYYSVFQPAEDGSVANMHAGVNIDSGVSLRLGIWSSAGTLLGSTSTTTGTGAVQDVHLALSSSVCLVAATSYILGVIIDSADSYPYFYRSAYNASYEIRAVANDVGTPANFNTGDSAQDIDGRLLNITANNSSDTM